MDETQSGDAVADASEPAGAFAQGRTRAIIAAAAALVLVVLLVVFLATRDSGGSSGNAAGATGSDHTSTTARDGSAPGGKGTTVPGSDGSTSGTGPGGSQSSNGSNPTGTSPGNTSGSGGTTRTTRPSTGTTNKPTSKTTAPAGTVPPTLTAAYTAGYQAECRRIWATTADADDLLWDADWLEQGGVKVDICYSQEDPVYAGSYDTMDDARQGAAFDADSDMSDWTLGGTLINTSRTKTWTGD